MRNFLPSLTSGIAFFRRNSQLWWTIVTALIIAAAFVFVAQNFIGIAQDAQERLVNVRVGSIHDTFEAFAVSEFDNPQRLQSALSDVLADNQTIRSFIIVNTQTETGIGRIIAAHDPSLVGAQVEDPGQIVTFALADPENSYTFEVTNADGERSFTTSRAIVGFDANTANPVRGYLITEETLSEADRVIAEEIRTSIIWFVLIVLVVMVLFFRHARIIDYTTLYQELKKVGELKDDFISMASHELRTPLTAIRGYIEMLTDSGELTEQSKQFAKRADTSASQLADLIEDMLDVSRIEQGRLELEPQAINPADVLGEVVSVLSVQAESKDLALIADIKTAPTILADPKRLRQVLINLIGNSIKYTPKGEVKVTLSTDQKKRRAVVRISDTGIGMTAEEQEGLFEKFHRVKNEQTEQIRGTGLGLWITKQLIEKMNGRISIESIKGVGTHVIVEFPLA
jgi:signal transduction histidine kinase